MDDRNPNTGLEDVTVAETSLSHIDGTTGGLTIGGFPAGELAAKATYAETAHLLFNGRLPTSRELDEFRGDLASRRTLDDTVREILQRAAADERPAMDALRMGVAALDEQGSREATARRIVAALPTMAATYWRYRCSEDPVPPDEGLGRAANYLYMLTGQRPAESEVTALETFLTAIVDHGLNPSTFAARVVVSTESDLVSGATAAIGSLKGAGHGGSLQPLFELLQEVHESELPLRTIKENVADGETLPGFGHSVYRTRDPRAAILFTAAERVYADTEGRTFLQSVREFESAATAVLGDANSNAEINATVELPAVALLHGIGVPQELFTATFAVSRVGGWTAHALEQAADNELVRPSSQYVGQTNQSWTPVERRDVAGGRAFQQPKRPASLEPVAETLGALAESARLEILLVLSQSEGPMSYSALRDATSIDDKGRFNYHLRQLQEFFVINRGDGYALTQAGETLVRRLIIDDHLLRNWTE